MHLKDAEKIAEKPEAAHGQELTLAMRTLTNQLDQDDPATRDTRRVQMRAIRSELMQRRARTAEQDDDVAPASKSL